MTKKISAIYKQIDRLIHAFTYLNVPCNRIALTETQFNALIQARKDNYGQHVTARIPLIYQGVKLYHINPREPS